MLINQQHFAVNWVNGMKLTQLHFLKTDLHVQDRVRDTASLALTKHNFGILPPEKGAPLSNEIQLLGKIGNSVEVRLLRCNAITAGGCRIAINPETLEHQVMSATFAVGGDEAAEAAEHPSYYAVLTVHPFERVPMGPPDPEELPIRHPFTDARYTLEMVQTTRIVAEELGGYYLIIGRVGYREGRYQVDEGFIPPCTTMESHPRLVTYYKDFGLSLNQLQINSFSMVRKVHDKPNPSPIAQNIQRLCVKILDFLTHIFFEFRNLNAQQPPVRTVGHLNGLASLVYTFLYCLPAREKEELLNYFYEWNDISPSRFEELLRGLIALEYQHHHIGATMQQVDTFVRVLEALWARLNNLEYIGQRKDNSIVVREEPVAGPGPAARTATRGWSMLD